MKVTFEGKNINSLHANSIRYTQILTRYTEPATRYTDFDPLHGKFEQN